MNKITNSLKTKILLLIGLVIILLMFLISTILLIKWREIIITKQKENALAISKTFASSVIDAIIFEEKGSFQKENILETYIENFIKRLGNVSFVRIFDKNGNPIVLLTNSKNLNDIQLEKNEKNLLSEKIKIYNHKSFGWILEVHEPFIFSGKFFGKAIIGFNAEPIRSEIKITFLILLISTIILTSIVLIILFYSINHMTSSLEKLVFEFDKVDFNKEIDINLPIKNDEIGFLYQKFKELIRRLELSKKELENAQKQIYQAEKLASIGRLASGVAHQVNNPLNGIKSCLYAIENNQINNEKTKTYLHLINEGISNIENVVKKLLGFARQQTNSQNIININEVIEKTIPLFDYRLKEKEIELKLNLDKNISLVKMETHLFQEIIMNLLLNSYDAINEKGEVIISTKNQNDKYVCIIIEDNGIGMDKEILNNIFDPFFTTKEVGKGTGLGLSVCLGIIESHNGNIKVESQPGRGTKIIINLLKYENEDINN
ncbi:MAG: ATP-binding protein [Melioribacteraceae bacterium]|nr:ATP-binding protein [Melioribacteraceae bacterium]